MKKALFYIITTVAAVLVALLGYVYTSSLSGGSAEEGAVYLRAEVDSIINRRDPATGEVITADAESYDLFFTCRADDGSIIIASQNKNSYNPADPREVEAGDVVIITKMDAEGYENAWFFTEFYRFDTIGAIIICFLILLLVFGRMKGLATAVSLALTVFAVFGIFIPAVLGGADIYLSAFLVCVYMTAETLLLVNGPNSKSLSAGLGCIGGVLSTGIITFLSDAAMHLTGFTDENSIYLLQINDGKIELRAILFAAIIIGAVGAIMDVAVNIASALHELALKLRGASFRELCASGFTIGRDMMGTMANTLVLAYIGGSLSSVLLIVFTSGESLLYLLNRESIITELLQISVGSLGMLLTIPLTSIVAALLYSRKSFIERTRKDDAVDEYEEFLREMSKE